MPNLQSTISKYPDFCNHGYEIIRELGRNWSGGRITYHAKEIDSDREVVIKEFRFALRDASWSSFKAYEREIQVLQQLDHPRIPRYLNSFETRSGFCLVMEYKNAPSLESRRNFTPAQVKQISLSVLEILVYLQQHSPPVIHRDIKPENILLDDRLNAYLVDFGLARLRGGEVAVSSVAAGTPGFMPPEEMFDRALTAASDLYSLGATLISLLTGTRSVDITDLIDDNLCFNFKEKAGQLSPGFIHWLTKITSVQVKQRYANAEIALSALKPIQVVGGATVPQKPEKPETKQSSKSAAFLLTTLSFVALLGTSLGIYWYNRPVNQLLRTGECRYCDLQNARLVDSNLRRANLSGANLSGADLENANLQGANLKDINLEDANLENAKLEDVKLMDANLQGANLSGVNLKHAYLQGVNFQDVNLQNVNLQGVNLQGADLQGVNLKNADLKSADLWRANLKNANLENANLGTNLWDANLSGANLKAANLSDAYLDDANLTNANLENAQLKGAQLKGANLQGANLQGANLQGAQLKDANLQGANLQGAQLLGVNLRDVKIDDATQLDDNLRLVWEIVNQGASGVNLGTVNLSNADLSNANLAGSNLEGANLKGTNLQDAKLQYANLEGANLQGVNLKGANLQSANLKGAQLLGANFWDANLSGAIMPDGTIHY